jgi:CDP-diacylglycerol--glycerol-3-phosphate 3-phosphatidyltransferase
VSRGDDAGQPGGGAARRAGDRAKAGYERGQAKVIERARGRVLQSGETKASDGNVANIITVVRILFAPAFIWLLLVAGEGGDSSVTLRWIATALFVVGIATDGIDGMLARSRNLVTNVGILLDPIADKVLIGGALVGLSILGELPWWVTIVILVREIGITVFRFSVLKDRVIPASRGGKLKTVFQAVSISFALAPLAELATAVGWDGSAPFFDVLNITLMSVAVALTVVSGADYLWQAYRLGRSAPQP